MHRFYVDKENLNQAEKSIQIVGEDVNHIKNVLRLKTGDAIIISDGEETDYLCRVREITAGQVLADIEDISRNSAELSVRITLFQGMPKSDKMELIIQKAVELGVAEVVPVLTKRTVVKIDEKKADKKIERYNSIALAAAKQSGRGVTPEVKDFLTFREALEYAKSLDMVLIPYEEAEGMEYSRETIKSVHGKKSLGIFIGPEGGFAREEVEQALEIGAKCITLGRRILRTETAGMAVLSILMFELEDE